MASLYIDDPNDKRLIRPIDGIYGLSEKENQILKGVSEVAFQRTCQCFSAIRDTYYRGDAICPHHVGQYATYLYFLSNSLYEMSVQTNGKLDDDINILCDKIFMSNATISNVDLYYAHKMPSIFMPLHPFGTVLSGKATIGDYFCFMQGCNIGLNKGKGPTLGSGILMWGGAKIVGDCNIGDYVMFAANTYIKDMDIPSNSIVFGQYPNVVIKENREDEVLSALDERFFLKL